MPLTQPKTDLAYLRSEKAKAEQQLRYYQHREKILEHQIPELTRKARVHRLCTRAGMLESFLICAGRTHQRSGDGAAENCVPSAGSCAGSCKDDSRPARKPQRSEPFRIKGAIIHRSGEIAVLQTAR